MGLDGRVKLLLPNQHISSSSSGSPSIRDRVDAGILFGSTPMGGIVKTHPADGKNLRYELDKSYKVPAKFELNGRGLVPVSQYESGWGSFKEGLFVDRQNRIGLSPVSVAVETEHGHVLIDPHDRLQVSHYGIKKKNVSGIVLTHMHYAQLMGIIETNATGDDMGLKYGDYDTLTITANEHALESLRHGIPLDHGLSQDALYDGSFFNPFVFGLQSFASERGSPGHKVISAENFIRWRPSSLDERIELEQVDGHAPGFQIVRIRGDETYIFAGEIIPTYMHLRPGVTSARDIDPDRTIQVKKNLISEAIEEDSVLIFGNSFDDVAAVRFVERDGLFEPQPVDLFATLAPKYMTRESKKQSEERELVGVA